MHRRRSRTLAFPLLLAVAIAALSSPAALAANYRPGDTVEAKFPPDEQWHKCSVLEVQPGKVFVMKRQDRTARQWVAVELLRDKKAEAAAADAEWKAQQARDAAIPAKTARDTIAVGDFVEIQWPVSGPWVRAKVLEVADGKLSVQYGGRYDVTQVTLAQLRDPAAEAAAGKSRALIDEIKVYSTTLSNLAHSWDQALYGFEGSGGFDDQSIPKYRTDLIAIAAICAKYPDITNPPPRGADRGYILDHPKEACAMAAAGIDVVVAAVMKARFRDYVVQVGDETIAALTKAMTTADWQVTDALQRCAFDFPAWSADMDKDLRKQKFAQPELPADRFKGVEEKLVEFKAFVDREGTTKAFEQPPYHDAAVEGLVRAAVAKQLKGAQVLRIGSDYNSWVAYDEKTWVGSDSTYDYFRVEKGKNQYKRGWLLAKVPGRPYCQAREWIAARVNSGAARVDFVAPAGLFRKCP